MAGLSLQRIRDEQKPLFHKLVTHPPLTSKRFSLAAKCSVVGAACVTVAAVELLQARSLLESFKTKAGSAFAFKRGAAASPSEHLSSSRSHTYQLVPEVDSNFSPDVTNSAVCVAGEHLSVFSVLETRAPDNDNEIIKASFATDDVVNCDCDNRACVNVPEDQVVVRSSTLQSSAINIKMQALDKLSNEAIVDGDPAASYDDSVRKPLNVVGGRSLDLGQHLDSTSDVVASVQTARGKLPLMPDLEAEAADVKAKAVHVAAIRDHHLDPIVEENAEVTIDVVKAQLVPAIGNCRANNANGRSWPSRVFKGTRDFVMAPINNIRSWMSSVFNNTGDFLRGFINRIRSWLGKMYGGIHGCIETVDNPFCAQGPPQFTKDNASCMQNLRALAVDLIKNWILDHQVILMKILLMVGDSVMETPSFCARHQSLKRLLMKVYRLLRCELIRC